MTKQIKRNVRVVRQIIQSTLAALLIFTVTSACSSDGGTSLGIDEFCYGFKSQNLDVMNKGIQILVESGDPMNLELVDSFLNALEGDTQAMETVYLVCEGR